jgi:hypothetical protein
MSMVMRAAGAPVASRADYWRHVVQETLGPLELRMPPAAGDQLRVGDAGAVRVAELTAGRPGGASRTARHVRRLDLEVCKVDLLVSGRGVVAQDGREAALGPGDFTLVDLSRPAHWSMSAMRLVAVVFPRALLPLPPDEVAKLSAVRFPGDQGAGALVSSLARQLARGLGDWGGGGGARLGGAVLDLFSVALATRLDRAARLPPRPGSGPCGSASTPFSRPGSATPGCRRPRSPPPTTSRSVPCTSCSRRRRPAWPAGSASAAWNAAGATCWTRRWRPGR